MKIKALLTVLTLLAISACTPSGEGEGDKPAAKRQFISIGTAPTGGAFFTVGNAMAQVVNDNKGKLDWQVSAESTKGTQENIRRLDKKELDFAMANAAISYFAVRGEGKWEKPYPIRAVMTLAPNVALFITPQSSGVKTIADLKGKRVVVGPAGAGFEYFIEPILKAHGVTYDDFSPLNATQTGAVDLLADGSASAAFLGGAVPTPSITQACAGQDIHFVPFDNASREQLITDYPFFAPITVAADKYSDLEEDYQGMNVGSMQLISAEHVDEETVYQFTKRLYEFREQVVKQHPAGKAINPKNVIRDTGTPFHPGAIRYYKEIGIWPEAEAAASEGAE